MKLIVKDLVKDLSKLNFENDHICDVCQFDKQTRRSFKSKNIISTFRPLELIHIDLLGSTRTISLGGKKYGLVIVDDFSYFTWILFLAYKDAALSVFLKFYRKVLNDKNSIIIKIRKKTKILNLFVINGIEHNFSALRTSQ